MKLLAAWLKWVHTETERAREIRCSVSVAWLLSALQTSLIQIKRMQCTVLHTLAHTKPDPAGTKCVSQSVCHVCQCYQMYRFFFNHLLVISHDILINIRHSTSCSAVKPDRWLTWSSACRLENMSALMLRHCHVCIRVSPERLQALFHDTNKVREVHLKHVIC